MQELLGHEEETERESEGFGVSEANGDNLHCLVGQMVAVIERTREDIPWDAPAKTYDTSYHGGDCSKHGRYYGTCACCDEEMRRHYADQRERFEYDRRRGLEELARRVKPLLPNAAGDASASSPIASTALVGGDHV